MHSASTPAQYTLILLDLARQRGVPPERLLEGTGVTEADMAKLGARVPEEVFSQVVERAYGLTGDRALGLHLGKRLNLSAHATVGQAFMTCENLEQVLNFLLKYYRILAQALELSYVRRDGRCWITAHTLWQEERREFSYEVLFAAFVHSINLLLNNPALAYRVEFPYPEPEYVDEYRELFGDDLHFMAHEARISLPEQWLEVELPSSNPALLALYEQECRRLLADLEEDGSLTEQTLQLLRKLEGHYPQMPQVADMLSISPRTYRRRLAAEDTSFQQLLDQVRTEHAVHYLRTTRLPLASIAFMVGFNDVSNFRRAFIKWTGRTPREARESATESSIETL